MDKSKSMMIVIAVTVVALIFIVPKLGLFSVANGKIITPSIPNNANPGSSFTITYTASGVSNKWGAIIVQNAAGGCKFPDGTTQYKNAMLSTAGTSTSVAVTTPASGSCTFTGYYQFDVDATPTAFNSVTTNLCIPKTCSSLGFNCGTTSDGCIAVLNCGTCSNGISCVNNHCCTPNCVRPSNQCTLASSVQDGCGGTCAGNWTIVQNTVFDSDCNNQLNDLEILSAITQWTSGTATDTQILNAIQAWVGS